MKDSQNVENDVRDHVEPRVRRRVGLKVLGDLGRWADGVEREQRERPRVVLGLLALVLAIAAATAWLVL
jgi:hypothetical protein